MGGLNKCNKGHVLPRRYKRDCPYCVSVEGFKVENELKAYMAKKYGKNEKKRSPR